MISNEGKMEKSFLNFKAANPDWNPTDASGSLYLSRMADLANTPAPGYLGAGGGGAGSSALPFNPRDPHSIAHLYRRRHFREQPPHQPVPGLFHDHVHFVTSPGSGMGSSTVMHVPSGGAGAGGSGGGDDVGGGGGGKTLAEKAQEYDWALKQSQNLATARRSMVASRVGGMGGSMVMTGSGAGAGAAAATSVYSAERAADLAKTVVLEDSHVDQPPKPQLVGVERSDSKEEEEMIGGSGLGLEEEEYYVDGAKRERMGYGDGQDGGLDGDGDGEEEFLEEDGGVLGLLAQIYGRRDGPAVRGI
jgi:autophagy-related protein 9